MQHEEPAADSDWLERVEQVARAVRCRVLDHTLKNNGGYLSQACSAAEILATLYLKVPRVLVGGGGEDG